jgi:hypothetical protein
MLKKILWLLALGVVALVITAVAVTLASMLRHTDSRLSGILLAAFMGAFCSFLFVRLGEALTRLYQRQQRNQRALVILQHRLNYSLVIADDNIWLVDLFLKNVSPSIDKGEAIRASADRLNLFRVDEELLVDLVNIDLINELFALNVTLHKANDSIDTMERLYQSTLEPVRTGSLDQATALMYTQNMERILPQMKLLRSHLIETQKDLVDLLAKVRVLSRRPTVSSWILRQVVRLNYPPGFERRVVDERRRLEIEMQQSGQASQEKIERVRKGADRHKD